MPNKFRLFCVYLAEGCRLQGGLEGGGWPRKENYKSFDEACCVLKKKGHRGRGFDGVGSRRASSREIQLPLNKLIHCSRPSATFSVGQRSNNPPFPPFLGATRHFPPSLLSFFPSLPFPILSFFLFLNIDKLKHRLFSNLSKRIIVVSLSRRTGRRRRGEKRGEEREGRSVSIKFDQRNE